MEDVLQGCGDTCGSGSFRTAHFFVWAMGPPQMMPMLIESLRYISGAMVVRVYHSIFIQILVMGSKMQARNLQ